MKNTIFVMTGDHGEAHMERGVFTHGTTVYDDALAVPMALKFPGQTKIERYKEPIYHYRFAEILEGMVSGRVSRETIKADLDSQKGGIAVLRTCDNTIRGLRFENEWKYFVDVASGEVSLFDLRSDPRELKNVADQHPEIVSKLDALYWQNYEKFTSQRTYVCPGWVTH